MNKFIKIFTMFFLITFSSTLYADAPGPVNLSLKGIVDWVRFFQFVEYGTALPSTPSTRGVWFILWVNNEPALYWSNGSEWVPFTTAGVQADSVTTEALADGAVTTPKLANSAVTSEKLDNGSVTTYKIADNAVTGTKFANNSITTSKLANSAVTSEKLGYLSVGTNNIQNGAVTSEKISSTIENKNIVLNNGTISNPSLSFSSNQTSGLSYDSASSTIDVSINASDKIRIGSSFIDFNNMIDGLIISSASEKIVLQSNGLHHDDISLVFNNDILASGSILPSENLTFNLGSSDNKWNNLYTNNIFSENFTITDSQIDNLKINNGTIYPLIDNTGEIGTSSFKFKSGNFYELKSDNIIISNASFTNIETDYILANNASVTNNITVLNNLDVKGVASFTSILLNGEPISGGGTDVKYPRGTLFVDVDCGKYSLRSLGKDLVLFSDAFMMIDYNVTDDGNYFTFKSATASPAVMVMDKPISTISTLTIRLDYDDITLDSNLHYLMSIQNTNGDFVTSFYNNNGKFYISFFNGNETLIDFDETSYTWNNEKNIYLTLDFSETGYVNWKMNIDGVDVYSQKTSVFANTDGYININSINVGNGNNGNYSISQDFNAKYRRIQIYPYILNSKEMVTISLLQSIADQQRELSKNMTRCPYYTLGEPSTLIGGDFNEGEGFFGEVTGDKFIYPWEVLGQLWGMDMNVIDTKAKFIASFTSVFGSNISYTFTGDSYTALGVSDNLEVEWLKFYDHGYLIFIPKRPLLNNITWQEINNVLGGYEGKEIKIDLRRNNANHSYANGTQLGLKCRMIYGGNNNPFIAGNEADLGKNGIELGRGSEWNRLIYRVCDQIPSDVFSGAIAGAYSGGKQRGDNWFNYTGAMLGFGASNDLAKLNWCNEYCWSQNNPRQVIRASNEGVGLIYSYSSSTRYTNIGFRPALVLKVSNQ